MVLCEASKSAYKQVTWVRVCNSNRSLESGQNYWTVLKIEHWPRACLATLINKMASLVPRPHAPKRRESGDIWPIPRASLTLITFWREFFLRQSHCRNTICGCNAGKSCMATVDHESVTALFWRVNYADSKVWIFNETQGICQMSQTRGGGGGGGSVLRTSAVRVNIFSTGVTGYFAPQEIWHPHSISPRKMGTPSGNLAPPNVVVFFASLHAYYPRISCTPCPLS